MRITRIDVSDNRVRNPGDNLVKLHILTPFDLDPPPDRGLQGRLDRVLKSVGARSQLSVRARMITAVSNTKFKTHEGHPVSLVGLHGKDELLVLGPDWAIEKLARGEEPETGEISNFIANQRDFLKQELTLTAEAQTAISFIRDNWPRLEKLESRPEFKPINDGWSHEPSPQFIRRPTYGQDTKALSVEYEELESLRAAMKFARQYLKSPGPTTEESLNSAEAAFPAWIKNIEAAIEVLNAIQADSEGGKHPWWFAWTKGWAEAKEQVHNAASIHRPESICSPGIIFTNGREFLAYQKYTVPIAPEA